jgi:hypothetical protein
LIFYDFIRNLMHIDTSIEQPGRRRGCSSHAHSRQFNVLIMRIRAILRANGPETIPVYPSGNHF